jgi:hypothetical protein
MLTPSIGFCLHAVHLDGWGRVRGLQMVGAMFDHVMELRADPAGVLDRSGHAITSGFRVPPEVRATCLPHWKGVFDGPRPADRNVVGGLGAPQLVDVLHQERRVLGRALEGGELIEASAQGALNGSAVVADLPEDERVVELANVLDRIQHAADFESVCAV